MAQGMPGNYKIEDWAALEQLKRENLVTVARYGDSYALYRVDCSPAAP
jgi:hypothetical protein